MSRFFFVYMLLILYFCSYGAIAATKYKTNMKQTYYQLISEMKKDGTWYKCLALFDYAWKLEEFYQVYSLVLKLEPHRSYAYRSRISANKQELSRLGADYYGSITPDSIKRAIARMETIVDYQSLQNPSRD